MKNSQPSASLIAIHPEPELGLSESVLVCTCLGVCELPAGEENEFWCAYLFTLKVCSVLALLFGVVMYFSGGLVL